MPWTEEDEDLDFEWKEEDEEEVAGQGSALSRIRGVAVLAFLALLLLGAVYFVLRVASALMQTAS